MVNPEMDTSNCSSRYLVPEILMPDRVYSLGTLVFESSSRPGSIEVGKVSCPGSVEVGKVSVAGVSTAGVGIVSEVSWECTEDTAKKLKASKTIAGVNFHCIPVFFVLGKLT
jgi:hypothetical protein